MRQMRQTISRRSTLKALAGAGSLAMLGAPAAKAADTLRVGKAVAEAFGYVPLNVGIEYGIFRKYGLTIEEIGFAGAGKLTQGVIAGAVDISLSSGPGMSFIAKGAPEIAVATICETPAEFGISVGTQYVGTNIESLKGKKIGITSTGGVTDWLVSALNRSMGWNGSDAAVAVPIGGSQVTGYAALKSGQVDADLGSIANGYQLEEQKAGRLLVDCSQFVHSLELFTIFASNALVQRNPVEVRRFLQGWFESIRFMKTHKVDTVRVAVQATGYSQAVVERIYDALILTYSTTGKFDPHAIETLRTSLIDMKLFDSSLDMSKLYTEAYLPKS